MRSSTVRAVDDDLQASQPLGQGAQEMTLVELNCHAILNDTTHVPCHGTIPWFAHARFNGILDRVIEFVTAAGEELDAVVGHGVVRGREHHAQICLQLISQEGDSWRGHDAEERDIDSGAGEAGDERCLKELAADARIAADDGMRAPTEI